MRVFLSHSSIDKDVVLAVYHALERECVWLDRAEIEWGDLFLEKIADGIESATDFALFWSRSAAKSEWVRLEVNMLFIQKLRTKAIRLRVIALDDTKLPLYLKPFQVLSVVGEADPATKITEALSAVMREPQHSVRSKFFNRNDEIAKIEAAIDDPGYHGIWLFGFAGVGKTSLAAEAMRRLFENPHIIELDVKEGTGLVELALFLNAARGEALAESLGIAALEQEVRLSLETIAKAGQLLIIANAQRWLDEDGAPAGPLPLVLEIVESLTALSGHPVFFTSTRRPSLGATITEKVMTIHVGGLKDEHIVALIRNWFYTIYGREISQDDAKKVAPKLFGHPIAARLAAALLGDHSAQFLDQYPRELIALRRDLARVLLENVKLGPAAQRLMETLALAGTALPPAVIAESGLRREDEFQQAVAQCASAGLITGDSKIETHPLFQEFYWHRLHHGEYKPMAVSLAKTLKAHVLSLDKTSAEFASLLPVTFRLFAVAGDLASAIALRRDLSGELEASAVTLYNRREYQLAEQYIDHVLDGDSRNWRMRLYRARIRIRQERWADAQKILTAMLEERPGDIGVLHAMGWSLLRQERLVDALEIFSGIISRREHIASLRDAADCLHRLGKDEEALRFLNRAKERESENPFVLDLESRILEDLGQLEAAYNSGLLASLRDPLNAHLQNRVGVICAKQHRPDAAIPYFQRAIELDVNLFSPANSLAAAYIDVGRIDEAEILVAELKGKARTPSDNALLEHTKARLAVARSDLAQAEKILRREIEAARNVIPNLGVLVQVHCAKFDENFPKFQTIAAIELNAAENALNRIVTSNPTNEFIDTLRNGITERRKKLR